MHCTKPIIPVETPRAERSLSASSLVLREEEFNASLRAALSDPADFEREWDMEGEGLLFRRERSGEKMDDKALERGNQGMTIENKTRAETTKWKA
jgi:hypothetical protein